MEQKKHHRVCPEPVMASYFRSLKVKGSVFRGITEAVRLFDETKKKTKQTGHRSPAVCFLAVVMFPLLH